MATLTMSQHSHTVSESMATQRNPRRDPRKRLSAGATPIPDFVFPAAPAPSHPAGPAVDLTSPVDALDPVGEPGPELEDEQANVEPYIPTTPVLATSPSSSRRSPVPSVPHLEIPPSSHFGTSQSEVAADPLPAFSFGSGSGFDQATSISEVAPRRRHQHKRSTAQSIDISAIDLRPRTSEPPRTPGEHSDTSRTPVTPHRLTFGPSAKMEDIEPQPTPPSSRGSSIRFSDPPDLAAFRKDRIRGDENVIDLDMADVPNPPSPGSRAHSRRASMHSGSTRVGAYTEGHRRTESAPQLAPLGAAWMESLNSRRQSGVPSSFFQPMEDVFEEDEGDEPTSMPGMSNSALPSPRTTLGTPRLDTATSSMLSVETSHQSIDSVGDSRPISRRKLFGRKLMFWNSSASLSTPPLPPSGNNLVGAGSVSRRRFLPKRWLEKSRGLLQPQNQPTSQPLDTSMQRPQTCHGLMQNSKRSSAYTT